MRPPCRILLPILTLAAGAWAGPARAAETAPAPRPAETAAVPDLSAFRTVQTARTTQPRPPDSTPAGRAGYLGVHVTAGPRGRLVVEEVDPASPAARAGVEAGDVLVSVAGQNLRSAEALRELLLARAPGESVRLSLERRAKGLGVTATLGATSRPMKPSQRRAVLGVLLGEATERDGAPVQRVMPGSPAEQAGLKAGDMLLKVDGTPLTGAARLGDALEEKQPGDTVTLAYRRDGTESEVKVRLAADPGSDFRTSEAESRALWKKPVYRLAVIGIEYPDVKHNPAVATKDWEEALFSKGSYSGKNSATGQAVYGSLNDYYQELSCGAFRVEGRMPEWVEVSKRRADYSQGTGTGNRGELLTEALDLLLKRDGPDALREFDGVAFVYAGDRFRTTRGGIYWPHRASVTFRGRRLPYYICPEGGRAMTSISVFCHEFGHMLGLPDLYARPENPGSEGLGAWCAMSNEAGSGRPQHFGAWCKEQLGWLKPTVIDPTVKQKLLLAPVEGAQLECFKVLIRPDGSEYLLLENRRRQGFDGSLPAEGLLIWHVVGNRPILEESHGVDGPSGPRVFLGSVPYPSAANNAYTPYTTPSSRAQLGGGLPVYITNITRLADGRITFYIGYEFE